MVHVSFGNYIPSSKKEYFINGCWTDENNSPITHAKVGQKVRFHIQTGTDLPFDETFQYAIRDHDAQILSYTIYDSITINKNEEDKLKFNRTIKTSEIVILEFIFYRDIHQKIDDDIGIELELYVVCRYDFQTTELANTSDTWLNLTYDDSDLFIKPAFPEQQYHLPEVYTKEGDMVVYALVEGAKQGVGSLIEDTITSREAQRFITLKVRNLEVRTLGPEGVKKRVFQETIDLATGKVEKAMPYSVVEANEYYKIKKTKVVSIESSEALETFERDDIRAWDAQTGKIRTLDYGLKAWDAYSIISEMIKLVPNATSNEGMKLPDLSTIVGSIPPLAFVGMGIKVLEMTSAHLLQDIEEFIDQQMELQLQRAKFEGLAAVESLLKTSLGDSSKDIFYALYPIDKITLDRLFKRDIKHINTLITESAKAKYINPDKMLQMYKVLIKTIPNTKDNSILNFNILDTIFIL